MGKTKKVKRQFEAIELDELIRITDDNLIDLVEKRKFKRTKKTKRDCDGVIKFFGNVATYLRELKQLKSKDDE